MKKPAKPAKFGLSPRNAPMPPPRAPRDARSTPPVRRRQLRPTFHLTEGTFDAVRNCVVPFSGPPHRLTLAGFAEDAFLSKLDALQKPANKGRPFPKREGNAEADVQSDAEATIPKGGRNVV